MVAPQAGKAVGRLLGGLAEGSRGHAHKPAPTGEAARTAPVPGTDTADPRLPLPRP